MTLSYLITQAKYFESTKSGLIKEKKRYRIPVTKVKNEQLIQY